MENINRETQAAPLGVKQGENGRRNENDLFLARRALFSGDIPAFLSVVEHLLHHVEGKDGMKSLGLYHAVCGMVLERIDNLGVREQVMACKENVESLCYYSGSENFLKGLTAVSQSLVVEKKCRREGRNAALIQSINECILANLSEDISLRTVANAFYLNAAYLSRLYKRYTGHTIGEEITHRRMEMAKRMLAESEYRISQIAGKTGYDSPAYFARVFKRQEGMTPYAWRNSH